MQTLRHRRHGGAWKTLAVVWAFSALSLVILTGVVAMGVLVPARQAEHSTPVSFSEVLHDNQAAD